MWIDCHLLVYLLLFTLDEAFSKIKHRQRRYLLFTKDTQWGVFATVSIPLHPETTTSVAWFYEANYYTVDNATYLQPLLGDIPISTNCVTVYKMYEKMSRLQCRTGWAKWGRQNKRSAECGNNEVLTRKLLYTFIKTMLKKNNYPGRECLLRAICEAATASLTYNGVLGDLLHLALTPSASMEEIDLEDCFYEAEYRGILHDCANYHRGCPTSPLDYFSVEIDHF